VSYLEWLLIFAWFPLAVLWVTNWRYLVKYKKAIALCAVFALMINVPWDVWAIGIKIWQFPAGNILGVFLLNVPVEEYLFIIFVTVLISTLTLVLKERVGKYLVSEVPK
jgi:lycopene cyclase domain-containing protein